MIFSRGESIGGFIRLKPTLHRRPEHPPFEPPAPRLPWLRQTRRRSSQADCGCLRRCGAGPNDAASIAGSAAIFGHVGTAARAAQLLEHLLGAAEFDAAAGLAAREKAEAALEKGDAAEAEALLTETIGLNAPGGLPLVYRSRSKARVAIGDIAGALADAEEAIRITHKFPLVSLHL